MSNEHDFSGWVEAEMRQVVHDVRRNNLTPAKGAVIVKAVETAVKEKVLCLHARQFEHREKRELLPAPIDAKATDEE